MAMTKGEFLENLQAGRSRLWFFIDGLSAADFTAQQDAQGWTIQDHLLHLADWEKGMTAVLQHQSRWDAMGLDYWELVLKTAGFDEMNEALRTQYTGKTAQEAVDTLKAVQAAFDQALAATSEGDLQQPYVFFHPDKPTNDTGAPVIERLASNTYEHYDMHLEWMSRLLPVPNKAQFMSRLENGRKMLWDFINGLSEDQLSAKRDAGGWAIKDHLVNLAIWERGMSFLLRFEPRWQAMSLDPKLVETATTDELNDVIFQQHKDRSAAEVLEMLKTEQAAFDLQITSLGDEELEKPYNYYQPQEIGERSENPIFWYLAGNSFEHYEEHLPWMQALV